MAARRIEGHVEWVGAIDSTPGWPFLPLSIRATNISSAKSRRVFRTIFDSSIERSSNLRTSADNFSKFLSPVRRGKKVKELKVHTTF
jgi:hypothetical protein